MTTPPPRADHPNHLEKEEEDGKEEELDEDFDLFSDQVDDPSSDVKSSLQQRAELARRKKLARLPPPSQRTCAQNRIAYVLSGQRLQPTRLSRVFSLEECELLISAVVDYAQRRGGLQRDRHEKFATTDVPVSDLGLPRDTTTGETVGNLVLTWVSDRVLQPLARMTGFRPQDLGLKDLFVVCYCGGQSAARQDHMVPYYPIPSKQASLAIHSDGCLLSFSLLLNHHDAFEGGGTFFQGSGETFRVQQGDLLMHDAGLEHAGAEVISGQRIMLVGFVETVDVLREKLLWEKTSTEKRSVRQD
ncbi:hypothetical protein M406DRAFT_352600 [Cryphonectria parasitica EP155]|uniref:Fe2OG dioxygenase domain-containing protein n=1 Tax=Cryphonectria parasitica (strain ATCC 38755 / EP155) TaxID=660469 RepID=A0A9P4XWG7_CRYP1|nr:uncharacterized protein M406DRAFT_352600 [Cryphonectria parasitica EP155]KAF3762087.1 hypothetical protein M406DRAFT_352600 [Cryphonectria parasitica EP155]